MKFKHSIGTTLVAVSFAGPGIGVAIAENSVGRGSTASLGASIMTSAIVGWAAYQGSEFTVKSVQASADGVVLLLRGASTAVEVSAVVAQEAAQAASVGVGTSVKVIAESTCSLVGSGVLLAFVPNEIGRALLHSARHERRVK